MARNVEIKAIQVTFNVLDPDQRRLYEHAYSKSNSSGYLKRLIDRDLTASGVVTWSTAAPTHSKETEDDLTFDAEGFV